MQNANTLEAMEVARQLILVLKGTVESLQMNLSQERDDNEGLKLTIESLEDENARLQEELFKVQAGAVEEKDTAKENQAEAIEAIGEKLAFYYKDMKRIDPKKLTAEDGETLYNILDYTFKALKKAGVKMEKKGNTDLISVSTNTSGTASHAVPLFSWNG